jgi:hypothetical protein
LREKTLSSLFTLFALGLFSLPGALWGQEAYRVAEGGQLVQTLAWEGQEDVLYYEVEIETWGDGFWKKTLTGETETSFFEVSLTPGIYRYRVIPRDFLERPGPAAAWVQFEIFPARQPELLRFSPEGFYLDEDLNWVIHLSGRNFTAGAEVFLRDLLGGVIKPGAMQVEDSGNEIQVSFSYDQLDIGDYTICVKNPGGLSSELQNFKIAFRKPVDINAVLGYRPLVPLYGHINELFDTPFFPLGAYGRLSVIPFKQRWGYIGFELEPAWNYITVSRESFSVKAHMAGLALYGVYQYWLPNRVMVLDFRIGGGIYAMLDYHFIFDRGQTEPISVLMPAIAGGLSFQWFIKKPFFVEAGLDFTHFFTVDAPSPGYLRPFIGAGWQF